MNRADTRHFLHLKPALTWLCTLGMALTLQAQKKHTFTEGLFLQIPFNYGREAVYADSFLGQFYQNSIENPAEGKSWTGDTESSWMKITADTAGFFRPQRNAGGNLSNPNNPPGPGRIAVQTENVPRTPVPQRRGFGSSYLYFTYQAAKNQDAVLNIKGNSAVVVNGELHAGDPYRMGWLNIPVRLKKGKNEFYVRGTFVAAELVFPEKPLFLATEDLTLPDIVAGRDNAALLLGVTVVNATDKAMTNTIIRTTVAGKSLEREIPAIAPHSTRKVMAAIDGSGVQQTGDIAASISLVQGAKVKDEQVISLRSLDNSQAYRITFVSEIDGSVQYYAVNPAIGGDAADKGLFFSVHGAGVEALGQAQAYESKDWGTLVAPTNRRPRGFNWEDWGRLDALEVLSLAKKTIQHDAKRVYLTGHSMGGHGTWFLGATYPDKWAAIAPCAGYPTLKGYGSADGIIPDQGGNTLENTLLRSSNQSDVIAYATNYKPLGVYVLHGDADRTVPVTYARQMRAVLGSFHPDFNYYEYPGGSHWYSNESVDWKPLFDYFKWHQRKSDSEVNEVDFKTSNPGISASYYWATIYQQEKALDYSHIQLTRDLEKRQIIGKTDNVKMLKLDVSNFGQEGMVTIVLDSLSQIESSLAQVQDGHIYLLKQSENWHIVAAPNLADKGPHRNGTFKEAFQHNMVYVYGTNGTAEENAWAWEKVRYDAESWYYRGNGSFDIVADKDFDPAKYADRNIILVGNAKTNSAWSMLLADCPIQVDAGTLKMGEKVLSAKDFGGYFVWPKSGSTSHSIGVITGTGITGMKAATANQYFAGASGFPDYMFFSIDMLTKGASGLVDVGFFNNDWTLADSH